MSEPTVNRQIKDRLFVWLFGKEENKQSILELYNALNGTHYTDAAKLEINTIEDAVYLGMHNDVSFLLQEEMLSLWEEQSTINPNMPIRGLIYLAHIYDAYIETHELNPYGETRFTLPAPQYIVFYLGDKEIPDKEVLNLSDSFPKSSDPDFVPCVEMTATVLNVNAGHNQRLLDGCRALSEYSKLVQIIRDYRHQGLSMKEATNKGIDDCIENNILSNILVKSKAEVVDMLLTEYNEKKTNERFRKEGRAEGRVEGRVEANVETARTMIENNEPDSKIAAYTKLSQEQITKLRSEHLS